MNAHYIKTLGEGFAFAALLGSILTFFSIL